MRTLLDSDEYEMRYNIGIGQLSSSLNFCDLDRIVQAFATHFAVICVKAELDQLADGLKTLDIFDLLRSNPNKMRQLFVNENPDSLTADKMLDMFLSNLSPLGSNRRESEEAVVMNWVNYLQMIEGTQTNGLVFSISMHFISYELFAFFSDTFRITIAIWYL